MSNKLFVAKGDKALIEGSIEKWKKVVIHHETDGEEHTDGLGGGDCPLCCKYNKFFSPTAESNCNGCPIKEDTGRGFCDGTPYIDYDAYDEAHEEDAKCGGYHCEMLRHAESMLSYLKRLQSRCEEEDE